MYAYPISARRNNRYGGTEGFKTKDGHSMAIVVVAESWAGIGQVEHVNDFRYQPNAFGTKCQSHTSVRRPYSHLSWRCALGFRPADHIF